MTVTRYPPATSAPFARFKLTSSGREVRPDIEKGGRVVALTVDEELELLSEGWSYQISKLANNLQKSARASIGAVTLRNTKDDLRERARIAELAHFDAWRFGA